MPRTLGFTVALLRIPKTDSDLSAPLAGNKDVAYRTNGIESALMKGKILLFAAMRQGQREPSGLGKALHGEGWGSVPEH